MLVIYTVAENYKSPTLVDFSPTLHISLLHWPNFSSPLGFLFCAPEFLSYTADFSPMLHTCQHLKISLGYIESARQLVSDILPIARGRGGGTKRKVG